MGRLRQAHRRQASVEALYVRQRVGRRGAVIGHRPVDLRHKRRPLHIGWVHGECIVSGACCSAVTGLGSIFGNKLFCKFITKDTQSIVLSPSQHGYTSPPPLYPTTSYHHGTPLSPSQHGTPHHLRIPPQRAGGAATGQRPADLRLWKQGQCAGVALIIIIIIYNIY